MVSAAIRDTTKILQSGESPGNTAQPVSSHTLVPFTQTVEGRNAASLLYIRYTSTVCSIFESEAEVFTVPNILFFKKGETEGS